MTEPKIVYAYVDLAEGNGVPSTSPGHDWLQFGSEELKTLRSGQSVEFGLGWVTIVRGAEALRAAEREVIEAANERNSANCGVVFVERSVDQPASFNVKWTDGETGRWLACTNPALSHAVDLRDRLRARLSWTEPHDSRGNCAPNLPCSAIDVTREEQPVYLETLRAAEAGDPVNTDAPWVIQGEHGWVWRLTEVQVYELRRYGHVEDTRCNKAILFVARDWKSPIGIDRKAWVDSHRREGVCRACGHSQESHCANICGEACHVSKCECLDFVSSGLPGTLHVSIAKSANVCRICGLAPEAGPGMPFALDYGKEHAHVKCLERYTLAPGESRTITMGGCPAQITITAPAGQHDVRKLAEEIGKSIRESLNPKEPTMPKAHEWNQRGTVVNGYKAVVHVDRDRDEIALYVVDDRSRPRRVMVLAGVTRVGEEMKPSWMWLQMREGEVMPATVRLAGEYRDALKSALAEMCGMDYAALPPLVIECENSPAVRAELAEQFDAKQPGRSVTIMPPGARVADAPLTLQEANPVSEDISRRADLGNAYRRGKHVGVIFGSVATAFLAWGGLFALGHLRPEWLLGALGWIFGR